MVDRRGQKYPEFISPVMRIEEVESIQSLILTLNDQC